jgi:hypothetical protein
VHEYVDEPMIATKSRERARSAQRCNLLSRKADTKAREAITPKTIGKTGDLTDGKALKAKFGELGRKSGNHSAMKIKENNAMKTQIFATLVIGFGRC